MKIQRIELIADPAETYTGGVPVRTKLSITVRQFGKPPVTVDRIVHNTDLESNFELFMRDLTNTLKIYLLDGE